MSVRLCLALAVLAALGGVALRAVVPVRPVDRDMHDTLAFIAAMGPPR